MQIKIITVIVLICSSITGFSQGSQIISERRVNPYLQSSNQIYDPLEFAGRDVINFQINTFNVCRIQKSGIKSLSMFYFKSKEDSTLWRFYKYGNDGLLLDMRPSIGWYILTKGLTDSIKIDCSEYSLQYKSHKRGTNKNNYIINREKIIEKYDSLGYLIEHTVITKGILIRWLTVNAAGGTAKFHRYYDYSDDYKKVKCTWCFKEKLRADKCNTKLVYFFEFDYNRNLLSEKGYRENGSGELIFEEGFKYHYEYY